MADENPIHIRRGDLQRYEKEIMELIELLPDLREMVKEWKEKKEQEGV